MAKIELKELFEAQKQLDATIAKNHNISYETTRHRRIMACLVEIGDSLMRLDVSNIGLINQVNQTISC